MLPSVEDDEKPGSMLLIPPILTCIADAHNLERGSESVSYDDGVDFAPVSELNSSPLSHQGPFVFPEVGQNKPRRSRTGPLISRYSLRPGSDTAVSLMLDELEFYFSGNVRFLRLHETLIVPRLSLILTSSRLHQYCVNVCATEHPREHPLLVAAHDVDGITHSGGLRLGGHNLECNNTSPALDQSPRAASGIEASKDKRARQAPPSPKMPALLAYDDEQYTVKCAKAPTRTIGLAPASSGRRRKAVKGQQRSPSTVSWDVKRVSIDRNLVSDAWETGELLGEGTYGRVYRVHNKLTDSELALKVIDIRDPLPGIVCDGLTSELIVLECLSRVREPLPYLLRPTSQRSWGWCTPDGLLCTLTDYCRGGQLLQHAGRLTGTNLRQILAELVVGIDTLHKLGIVHQDLKPENILIDADGHCVIADYGSAKFLDDDGTLQLNVCEDILSTLPYAAPELASEECDEDGMKYYDETVDWWSLGAIVLTLVIGQEYFYGDTMSELTSNIPWLVEHIQETMQAYHCSADLIDFTMGLLTEDPAQRFRIPDIKCHDYFSRIDWQMVETRSRELIPPFYPPKRGTSETFHTSVDHDQVDWPNSELDGYDFLSELRRHGLELQVDDSFEIPN